MDNLQTPKISVIVPVYKAEAYLHRCVDSLLSQTFQDFEILLVDDGSPDKSGEICDEFAKMDTRVRVFHKENGGVSSARQCGMDHARGEYTIHADPDDWVDPTMLEELYRKAKEEDADMVICDFYEERKNKTLYIRQQPSSLDHETVLCELFQQLHGSCCNKLVKRACYSKFIIKFPTCVNYCEDLYFWIALLQHDINISYLGKAFYHYYRSQNPNSIANSNRKSMYEKLDKFLTALPDVLDEQRFAYGYRAMEYRLAYAAIVAKALSPICYVERFRHLLKIPLNEIRSCTNWEKCSVRMAAYGMLPIVYLLIEIRHVLGNVKRGIIKTYLSK